MNYYLDKNFKSAALCVKEFKELVNATTEKNKLLIGIDRDNGEFVHYAVDVFKDGVNDKANFDYIERFVKSLLWIIGGYQVFLYGSEKIYNYIKDCYTPNGIRAFDVKFMSTCFEKNFNVIYINDINKFPKENIAKNKINTGLKGKRLGFDAGGSDIKISSVLDGEVIYSDEIVWLPKLNEDIKYHQEIAYQVFKKGIEKLGGDVDSIGVSSAGVIINNRPMQCSLFIKAIQNHFEEVKSFYIDIVRKLEKELGHPIPFQVSNDGDVSAIAGVLDVKEGGLLGLAMGTSEAGGYITDDMAITGWFNELGFVPVDYNPQSLIDEWSLDYGVGCKYLSQDAVIKLAKPAGIDLDEKLTLAEKLKVVQKLNEEGHKGADEIFKTIGMYLAHAIAYYCEFYKIKHVLLLGRVTSGKGGDTILKTAQEILNNEFKELGKINIFMPTEYIRRVGQSIAAASLAK